MTLARIRRRVCGLALLMLCLALAACRSSPPASYYTLGGGGAPPEAAADEPGPSIVVGPVGVPPELDRPQIVRIIDGVRLEVAGEHRWAAPLKAEFGRRVAAGIARQRGFQRVVAWPQNSQPEPDMNLPIDIQRLSTTDFESVSLVAVWSLRRDQRELAGGRFAATEKLTRADHEGIVAAHARLADALAREIAERLPAR